MDRPQQHHASHAIAHGRKLSVANTAVEPSRYSQHGARSIPWVNRSRFRLENARRRATGTLHPTKSSRWRMNERRRLTYLIHNSSTLNNSPGEIEVIR